MAKFIKSQSLAEFQKLIGEIYSLPDDRLYSIWDLLTQQQRFAMRTVKGIRKNDINKLKLNLLISLSWLMAIANRLHIDAENEVWKRFPMICSYCGERPCQCKKTKPTKRKKLKLAHSLRPKNISGFQKMFDLIYPKSERTVSDAGIHFAEEVGEVSETIHNYLGQHKEKQFEEIKFEVADLISCIFGIANSAGINVAEELEKMFSNNCHVCHKIPCICNFTEVRNLRT